MKILENIQAQLLVWSQTAIVANKLSATTEEK